MRVEGQSMTRVAREEKQISKGVTQIHQVPSKHLAAGSSPAGGASATCENLASRSPMMSRTMCGRDAGAGQQGHPGVLEIVEADVQTQTLADRGPVSVEVP
ncbi:MULTISPECIES: hypothetical protein [Streptomyces]|uniref:hypothetical protein n=1 Tax=Streptomyces TaxID=1883 RepID=UPI0004BD0C2E|nr:hypothetical protein [Streptomyces sp. NRRL F-3307]KOG74779.1 hypothetical protein ADK77_04315 [Streptomyces antibioticus]